MIRQSPRRTATLMAANRANAQKSTGPRTPEGKQRSLANLKRHFARLAGVPEALALDQEPGAAIHLYQELIAPYEPAPALLAMHFRDLARLQLELEAWEGIRDAEMKHRTEQTFIEQYRRGLESDRELRATSDEIFEAGLCRLPDSCGKFNAECEAFWTIRELVKVGNFADLKVPLCRLYGLKMEADTEPGRMICGYAKRLMPEEQEAKPRFAWPPGQPLTPPLGPAPEAEESTKAADKARQEDLKELIERVQAEERKVMASWELALYERRLTTAACQARLATRREDHWMNRQGDRLRQAIDRKMRLTPILLKMYGLGGLGNGHAPVPPAPEPEAPEAPEEPPKHLKKHPQPESRNVPSNEPHKPKTGATSKAGMSFRMSKPGATSTARSQLPTHRRAEGRSAEPATVNGRLSTVNCKLSAARKVDARSRRLSTVNCRLSTVKRTFGIGNLKPMIRSSDSPITRWPDLHACPGRCRLNSETRGFVTTRSLVVNRAAVELVNRVKIRVNGVERTIQAEPETTLLNALRDQLDLTGAKYGCGEGQCGACTVLIDGKARRSCQTPAASVGSAEITTIEGLAGDGAVAHGDPDGRLHPVQQAFLDEGAFQCAYCTSGMILAAVSFLHENPHPTDDEIVRGMNGNMCRCGTYPRILAAVRRASTQAKPAALAKKAQG